MEIVKFEKQTWVEIPKQDNPAFDYIYENQRLQEGFKGRREHCLLICKVLPYEEKAVSKDGYVVIEVPLTGDVIRRGLFWNFSDADTFACALGDSDNESSGLHKHIVINWAFFPEEKPNYGDEIIVEFPPEQMTKKEVLIYGRYTDLMDGCKWALITPCL